MYTWHYCFTMFEYENWVERRLRVHIALLSP